MKATRNSPFPDRKSLVYFIQNVVFFLQNLYDKINQYLTTLSIKCPIQLHKLHTIALRKMLSFEFYQRKTKKQLSNFELKLVFPQKEQSKLDQRQKKIKWTSKRKQACMESNVRTNATTRPSLTGYRSPPQLKNNIISIQQSDNNDNNELIRISLVEALSHIQQKKRIKSIQFPSCKTSRPVTAKQVVQRSTYSSRKNTGQNLIKNKMSTSSFKSNKNKSSMSSLKDQNSLMIKQHVSKGNQKNIEGKVLFQQSNKRKVFQKIKNIERRPRRPKQDFKSDIISNKNLNNLLNWQKGYEKQGKTEKKLYYHQKRHQSAIKVNQLQNKAQQMANSNQKPLKVNHYKRKNKILRTIKITETAPACQESEVQKQEFKHSILLIRAPEQKSGGTQKKIFIQNQRSIRKNMAQNQGQEIKKRKVCLNKNKAKDNCNVSQKQISFLVNNKIYQIQIGQINKIRSQFIQARWQNKMSLSNDKQNSVFFLEQGFLGHKQNLQFQKYLKELKELTGKQLSKQPFNIETQLEDYNNLKVRQLQRNYTFKIEDEWIRQHLVISSNNLQFHQQAIDFNKQFNI